MRPTRETAESAWLLLPASTAPDAAQAMSQARTAETGKPQRTTKMPVRVMESAMRHFGESRSHPRTTARAEAMTARCPPETATRCETPQAEKRSESPSSWSGAWKPRTDPTSSARSGVSDARNAPWPAVMDMLYQCTQSLRLISAGDADHLDRAADALCKRASSHSHRPQAASRARCSAHAPPP